MKYSFLFFLFLEVNKLMTEVAEHFSLKEFNI